MHFHSYKAIIVTCCVWQTMRVGCDVISGDVYKHDKHKWTSNKHRRLALRRAKELQILKLCRKF